MPKTKLYGLLLAVQCGFGVVLGGLQVFEMSINTSWWMTMNEVILLSLSGLLLGVGTSMLLGGLLLFPMLKSDSIITGIRLWTLASVIHVILLFIPFVQRLLVQQENLASMMIVVCLLFCFLIWSNASYWLRKLHSGETPLSRMLILLCGTGLMATVGGTVVFRSHSLGTTKAIASDPDILVLSIDGLGANAVSSLSQSVLASTPNIDALASQCVQYTDAITVASEVLPAQTAMLSGHYPGQLGVLNNQGMVRFSVETIAERFAREGYATAIFADNPALTMASGFAQGFQLIDVKSSAMLQNQSIKGLSQFQIIKLLEDWLVLDAPMKSIEHTTSFLSDYVSLPVFTWTQVELPQKVTQTEFRDIVEEVDEQVGDFVRMVRDRNVDRETLLILTSGFGTHFEFEYGSHYGVSDSVMKVPLIICPLPDKGSKGGDVVTTQVRTIDIPNTIYAQVGFSHNPKIQSIDISNLEKGLNVYQTLLMGEDASIEGGYELGYRFQASNSDRIYKYRWQTHRKLHAIYNLSNDPLEQQNIVESADTMSRELSTVLTQATRAIPELNLKDSMLMIEGFQPIP